ncbi:hypothetical protein [Paenibacillus melissococcoides]|uniref:hypothetical protein n=1 Tax=Paenibacillus melissococcoides TaxID=2912268 RepID=UPI0021C31C6E|nr:hypothetical protein [Paenibacillus melissococcoides]
MTEQELMARYKDHVTNKEYTLAISKDGEPCEIAGKIIEDLINVDGAHNGCNQHGIISTNSG